MVLIDTHVWLWWVGGVGQLHRKYRDALQRLPAPPFLSVISLWEVSLLIELLRVDVLPNPQDWFARATRADRVQLAQIDRRVAQALFALPKTMPRDPADRIIAATARALDVPVLTMDRALLRSGAIRLWDV